jgi:hypothetical protein
MEEWRKRDSVSDTTSAYSDTPFAYLPKDIALHYFSLCALKAAEAGKRDLVADGQRFTEAVFYEYSIEGEVGATVLQAYLPENFFNMVPGRIAEFREDFRAQRHKYQGVIQDLVEEYERISSEGQLELLKDEIVEVAKKRADDTQGAYRRAKLGMALKTFSVSLTPPALLTSIGSA